jgi:hypothetical protein
MVKYTKTIKTLQRRQKPNFFANKAVSRSVPLVSESFIMETVHAGVQTRASDNSHQQKRSSIQNCQLISASSFDRNLYEIRRDTQQAYALFINVYLFFKSMDSSLEVINLYYCSLHYCI